MSGNDQPQRHNDEAKQNGEDQQHQAASRYSSFKGALLKEKMPRFAHSRFRSRLFVLRPNIRFGLI